MKNRYRTMAAIMLVVWVFTVVSFQTVAASPFYGDLNRNSVCDTTDARHLVSYIAHEAGLDEEQVILADYDRNGVVNSSDARGVLLFTVYGGEYTPYIRDVSPAVGTTYPPVQKPAAAALEGYDIDIMQATADDVYAYIDDGVAQTDTVTKELLGTDAGEQYEIMRYTYARRAYLAWVHENHPKMYAWKHGDTVRYTRSVSPRIGDAAYDAPDISQSSDVQTITAVSATNRSRTVGGAEYVRYADGDVVPTVIYTDADDERSGDDDPACALCPAALEDRQDFLHVHVVSDHVDREEVDHP